MRSANVTTSDLNPEVAATQLMDPQATFQYIGVALSIQSLATNPNGQQLTVVSVTAANPAVVNVVAHGLLSDNFVNIVNGTGSWAAINGRQVITKIDANNFSIPINTTGFAGSFAGQTYTRAAPTNAPIWSIKKIYLDGSGNPIRIAWAQGSTDDNKIWDNRATYDYD